MADAKCPLLPPAFSQSGLLAELLGIGEEDLAGDGEDFLVGEPVQQWCEKIALHSHVAVEQHDDVVPRGAEACVRSAAEAEILFERDHANLRKGLAEKLGAAVGRSVVDHDDFATRR